MKWQLPHDNMETLTDNKQDIKAGKRFRLTVKSAEEAVRVIREKLGDNARVLSVRQVGGEGLKKFISSPKLEVIAEIPSEVDEIVTEEETEINDSQPTKELKPVTSESKPENHSVQSNSISSPTEGADAIISESDSFSILTKAGFDSQLLGDIKTWSNWTQIKDLSLADTLKEITVGLSDRFRSLNISPVDDRIALLGAPGVGKTTTLCKFLAHDVFMNAKTPNVLKIENGVPNPDDALKIFCEVVGVTLYRESNKIPDSSGGSPLYLDFPGLSLGQSDEWLKAKDTLDDLEIKTRVLVLNSAYDKQVLKRTIALGNNIGATHLAFSHFDELTNSTKLWPLLLRNNLSPLCICNGQNVTGDFSTNVLNQFIARTFPEELYARGFSTYRNI
jgi:flagellar biosynthesis protein FlhF